MSKSLISAAIKRMTKVVATVGPSSTTPKMLSAFVNSGVDVVRLNFSHDVHESHAKRITAVRAAAEAAGRPVALMQDLCGPKIRTGKHGTGKAFSMPTGSKLIITTEPEFAGVQEGDTITIGTTFEPLHEDVKPGDTILISDGNLNVKCVKVEGRRVECEVVHGGKLKESQGLNLPGIDLSTASITEKDVSDLEFGIKNGVDLVAVSFVRTAEDVKHVQGLVKEFGGRAKVIAKIEMPQALDNLAAIIEASDGVMVARGDLGVEMPPEEVPIAQKRIIAAANENGIPVIVATQMLESMILAPRPTRAEVSDVTNAIFDGADACMLSAESAAGEFPLESVQMMASIAKRTNQNKDVDASIVNQSGGIMKTSSQSERVGSAAALLAESVGAKGIACLTGTGQAALGIARAAPECPIFAMTPDPVVARQLNLSRGVFPFVVDVMDTAMEATFEVEERLIEAGAVEKGDIIVMTSGHPINSKFQETNMIKVHEVGSIAREVPM